MMVATCHSGSLETEIYDGATLRCVAPESEGGGDDDIGLVADLRVADGALCDRGGARGAQR